MYACPQMYGSQDYLCEVPQDKVNICLTECTPKSEFTCEQTMFELCCLIMSENNLERPNSAEDGVRLYGFLREEINKGLAEYQ